MNNDLISREELKKTIETWDKFACLPNGKLEPFRNLEHSEMFEPYVHLRDILNAVENAPIVDAYSFEQMKELFDLNNKLIKEIEELKEQMEQKEEGEWIPVSKRLPEHEGTFLVTDIKGKIYIENFYFQIGDKTQSYWSGMKVVIAWQPLPKPYKEAKQ